LPGNPPNVLFQEENSAVFSQTISRPNLTGGMGETTYIPVLEFKKIPLEK
jgi:hypothetical protein